MSPKWKQSDWPLVFFVLTVVYALAYLGSGFAPGANPAKTIGWWGFWDQSRYLGSTTALAAGLLGPDNYHYPLGYPLLGAAFFSLLPKHPYFLVNLVSVGLSTWLLCILARPFFSQRVCLGLLALFVCLTPGISADSLLIPWNTIPTMPLSYAVFALCLATPLRPSHVLAASALSAVCYVIRPSDAFILGPSLAWAVLRLPGLGQKIKAGAGGLALVGLSVVLVAGVNMQVFGTVRTPYDKLSADIGFGNFNVAWKSFAIFADTHTFFREPRTSLFSVMPWLAVCLPGIVYAVRTLGPRCYGVLASLILAWGLYLAYNDFWPENILRFYLIHYLYFTLPLLFLAACLSFARAYAALPKPVWGLLALVPLLAASFLGFKEIPVGIGLLKPDGSQQRWIFEGTQDAPGLPLTKVDYLLIHGLERDFTVTVDGTQQKRLADYFLTIHRDDGSAALFARPKDIRELVIGFPQNAPPKELNAMLVSFWKMRFVLRWPF